METSGINVAEIEPSNELQLLNESSVSAQTDTSAVCSTKPKRMSKTEKKFAKYQRKIAEFKLKKLEKKKLKANLKQEAAESNDSNKELSQTKESKPQEIYESYLNKREIKKKQIERMKNVLDTNGTNSLKICIDCSFSDLMSDKESSRLAQQIGRCYASNKALEQPVYLTLCNLKKDSKFYKECCRVNDGFANYLVNKTEKSIEECYSESLSSIAYLSPDSTTLLENVDSQTTYVIGGLVDETVNKKVTFTKCSKLNIRTYALPIEKYMTRRVFLNGEADAKAYNFNKILAINQVFDILANYFLTNDWCKSLEVGVPKRKGFIVDNKQEDDSKDSDSG